MDYRAARVRCAARLFSRLRCFAASFISVASVVFHFVHAPLCVPVNLLDVFLRLAFCLLVAASTSSLSLFFLCALFLLCCVSTTCVEMTNECVFHRLLALPSLCDL